MKQPLLTEKEKDTDESKDSQSDNETNNGDMKMNTMKQILMLNYQKRLWAGALPC